MMQNFLFYKGYSIISKDIQQQEVVMSEQDQRAVESMCRCGLDLQGVISLFPMFREKDVIEIFESIKGQDTGSHDNSGVSINCS